MVRQENADDLNRMFGTKRAGVTSRAVEPARLAEELDRIFSVSGLVPLVLLSTTLWEAAGAWQEHERVMPVHYEIQPDAWGLVADAVGLPLGLID